MSEQAMSAWLADRASRQGARDQDRADRVKSTLDRRKGQSLLADDPRVSLVLILLDEADSHGRKTVKVADVRAAISPQV